MSDFICTNYYCPNRTSFEYCGLTACNQICPQTRWTDKLTLDSEGNIRDFEGNIVGHYDVGMFQDYTANTSKSIEFVVKENNNRPHLRWSDYDNNGDVLPTGYKRLKDGTIIASNWKRHIVDNGYNADWKCKECEYVVKTDYPPMECPNCMRGK